MDHLIHGAKWWKFDFHNHTPASDDFGKGDEIHKNIGAEDWLLMYMRAGIDCVAITDHNSGEWIDRLKETLERMKESMPAGYRKIYLFPGVEISATGNIHILALFDTTAGTKEIQALLGAVGFPSQHIGTTNAVSTKSVEEIIKITNESGAIAIPAHVDKPSGLFTLTGYTLTQAISADGLLALELIDKGTNKPELYKQSGLQLAEVAGSDSHIAAQVGSNYTWVKMGEPSLDALKLALHDMEDGVIRKDEAIVDPNIISNRYFIKSISIDKGFKAGNGTSLSAEFSPWLTSIIGGRGSGKSTVVNYLRIAFARVDEMPSDVQREFDNFNQIGKKNGTGMLRNDTTIKVEVFKDGRLQLLTWHNSSYEIREWNNSSNDWGHAITVSNIKTLFPIQIFSQKELYALTGNPSKLLELIDSQFDKASWIEERNGLVNKWIADRATRRQLKNAILEEPNIKAQLVSVNNKISIYESSAFKDTLNNYNRFSELSKFFSDTNEDILKFISRLNDLEQMVPEVEVDSKMDDVIVDESRRFIDELNRVLISAKDKLMEIIGSFASYKDLQEQINQLPWFKKFEAAKQAYERIERDIQELGTESYDVLIQKKATLNDRLGLIEEQKEKIKILEQDLRAQYSLIVDKETELRIKRREVIGRWRLFDDSKNPLLIIELHAMGDAESANLTFRELLRKSSGEFASDIYSYNESDGTSSGLISRIINEPEATRWKKRHESIVEFFSATEVDKKNIDLRLARHLDQLRQNTPEDIDRLYVWFPEDKLVLKFRKHGKEEDIQTGSAGERTAGMLGLLLALNEIPLIIDQPEDDLDTKLISSFVVEGFKKLKKKRQLLIVTHNPNIAVNANSDNVVHMDFSSGQVVKTGNNALQDKQIRNAVCEVMEGGREALNKRYYRISKALK